MKSDVLKSFPLMRKISENPFSFLWEAFYGFRVWVVVGIIGAFFLSLSKILLPVFFSKMVDYFSRMTPETFLWNEILYYLLLMLIIFLSTSLLRFFRMYVEEVFVTNKMKIKLGIFGVDYVSKHSENYMSGQKSGQISQKILGLKDNCSRFYLVISRMASCLFLIGITFFYIGRISILFVLVTIVVGLISSFFSYKKSFVLKEMNKKVTDKFDQYIGTLADSISNTLIVKIFGREKYEQNRVMSDFNLAQSERLHEIVKMQNIVMVQKALMSLFEIGGAGIALFLWYTQKIGVGEVALILLLQGEALANFNRFMTDISHLNQSYGEVTSSLVPFLVKHEIVDVKNAKKLIVKKASIKFEDVSFAYDKNKVFDGFCLEIKAKEKIGIIGKSGSGKSTMIALLQRLYDLDNGKITIDGQDISKVKHESLFENIAIIPQDISLFHRTIKQNIAYGNEMASNEEIVRAAVMAHADEFIKTLPRGYETLVGEKGIKLSGGQRQRIAIARAILKNSPILILDEATSALDNESEYEISKSMRSLMKGKTVIAVAHRLSTLREMDRIIVIEDGKIVESGTPNELIDKKGKFALLWDLQMN